MKEHCSLTARQILFNIKTSLFEKEMHGEIKETLFREYVLRRAKKSP